MEQPQLIDLFAGAGGAGHGYHLAGFAVTGVDDKPRPSYPHRLVQADALSYLAAITASGEVGRFQLIHASPPCQAACALTVGTNASQGWGGDHRDLLPELRVLLEATGLPYVIEQPAGRARIRKDLRLCMDMWPVDPPRVFRHRHFEVEGFACPEPPHPSHRGPHAGVTAELRRVRGMRHGVVHAGDYVAAYGDGGGKATVAEMRHALGMDWTDVRSELTEAIPPAFTAHIGAAFLAGAVNPGPAGVVGP